MDRSIAVGLAGRLRIPRGDGFEHATDVRTRIGPPLRFHDVRVPMRRNILAAPLIPLAGRGTNSPIGK